MQIFMCNQNYRTVLFLISQKPGFWRPYRDSLLVPTQPIKSRFGLILGVALLHPPEARNGRYIICLIVIRECSEPVQLPGGRFLFVVVLLCVSLFAK